MNTKALSLIKSFEGCRLTAYQDIAGIWTIGFGQTGPDIRMGLSWTQREADKALMTTVSSIERHMMLMLEVEQNINQMAALIDFAYNLGLSALQNSTLLKKINKEADIEDIANEFLKWDKANGRVVAGLTRRRKAEHDLYLEAA